MELHLLKCRAAPTIISIWTAAQPVCRRTSRPFRKSCPWRHFSIGADGIICICAPVSARADAMMRIFNADGSRGQDVQQRHPLRGPSGCTPTVCRRSSWPLIPSAASETITRRGEGLWRVEIGAYSTLPADLPAVNMGGAPLVDVPLEVDDNLWRVTCINVGNPTVLTVVPDVDALRLEEIGPAFEHHANFPERINTEFVQVMDATHLKMRVWGARQRRDLGLRHRHLRHGGSYDRARHLPRR